MAWSSSSALAPFSPRLPPSGDDGDADTSGSAGDTGPGDAPPPTVADAVARLDLDGADVRDAFAHGDGAADILLSDGASSPGTARV